MGVVDFISRRQRDVGSRNRQHILPRFEFGNGVDHPFQSIEIVHCFKGSNRCFIGFTKLFATESEQNSMRRCTHSRIMPFFKDALRDGFAHTLDFPFTFFLLNVLFR